MEIFKQNSNLNNFKSWFDRISAELLNEISFSIAGEYHPITEIEFYYHDRLHPDPFTHRDPLQLTTEKWYFHRIGKSYRGGTFKGLDITFGDNNSFGGILIRSIETPQGDIIDGSCLCVDYILEKTGFAKVAELDKVSSSYNIWNNNSPIFLERKNIENRSIFTCARVGLSLKKAKQEDKNTQSMTEYLVFPYRYLNRPRKIRKGKVYLVLGLYLQRKSSQEIHQITGSPKKSIENYIQEFEKGYREGKKSDYFGISLKNTHICQLHGIYKRNSIEKYNKASSYY